MRISYHHIHKDVLSIAERALCQEGCSGDTGGCSNRLAAQRWGKHKGRCKCNRETRMRVFLLHYDWSLYRDHQACPENAP